MLSRLFKNKSITELILWLLICLYIASFGFVSFLEYQSFDYGDFDLAVHSQAVWNILHGSIYSSILGIDFLGNHAHLILFLIAPLYLLFQSPLTLLFLQTLSLALTAYPIYLIAKKELNERMALTIAFAYLIYPALGYTNLFEFHPTVFATLFLTLMFYYFMKGAFKKFVLFMFLSLLCQENISLIVILTGAYAFFVKKGIRWTTVPVVSGLLWFWMMVGRIIPYFNKDTVQFLSIYANLGDSVPEIVKYIVTHPIQTGKIIINSWNMTYLLSLFMPLSFFSLFDPQILIIFPLLMQHLLSNRPSEQTIYYHYTAEMIPIVFVSAVYGIKRFFRIPYIKKYFRQGIFISIILISAITSNAYLGPHLRLVLEGSKNFKRNIWDYQKQDFIKMVPRDAGVVSTFDFLPRLSHRKNLYSFHHVVSGFYTLSDKPYRLPEEAEYALLDFNDYLTFSYFRPNIDFIAPGILNQKSDINLRNFLQNGNWGVVDMIGSIVFLKKNYESDCTLYQVLDKLPKISSPVSATVEGGVELIGYNVGDRDRPKKNQIELTFFWRALKEVKRDYGCFIYILDKDGKAKYRFTKPICYRAYPSYAWQKKKVVKEAYRLLLPPDVRYDNSIKMSIFDYKDRKIYPFTSSVSNAVDEDGRVNLIIKDN